MNETAPLQKQDINPIYRKLDDIIQLLEKVVALLGKVDAIK